MDRKFPFKAAALLSTLLLGGSIAAGAADGPTPSRAIRIMTAGISAAASKPYWCRESEKASNPNESFSCRGRPKRSGSYAKFTRTSFQARAKQYRPGAQCTRPTRCQRKTLGINDGAQGADGREIR